MSVHVTQHPGTVIEALARSLAGAARYNPNDVVRPCAVLWTDYDNGSIVCAREDVALEEDRYGIGSVTLALSNSVACSKNTCGRRRRRKAQAQKSFPFKA